MNRVIRPPGRGMETMDNGSWLRETSFRSTVVALGPYAGMCSVIATRDVDARNYKMKTSDAGEISEDNLRSRELVETILPAAGCLVASRTPNVYILQST